MDIFVWEVHIRKQFAEKLVRRNYKKRMLAILIAAFYGITLAEWLYKTAVRHELNRALWPILGLVLNLFALPLLLVALCDPKHAYHPDVRPFI